MRERPPSFLYFLSSNALSFKDKKYKNEGGLSLIPHEPLPYLRSIFNVNLLGIDEWGKLFNRRQCLALVTLIEKTKQAVEAINVSTDEMFSTAIGTCLSLAIDRCADYWS